MTKVNRCKRTLSKQPSFLCANTQMQTALSSPQSEHAAADQPTDVEAWIKVGSYMRACACVIYNKVWVPSDKAGIISRHDMIHHYAVSCCTKYYAENTRRESIIDASLQDALQHAVGQQREPRFASAHFRPRECALTGLRPRTLGPASAHSQRRHPTTTISSPFD